MDFKTAEKTLDSSFFPAPYSQSPLDSTLLHGLYGPGTLGALSVASTSALLCFIVYRFLAWRKHYHTYIGYNQYVVLVLNLLIADLLQGISFVFSFHWIKSNAILAPTRECFSQGFILNLGDVSSGLFVFYIALHTFYSAVKGRRIRYGVFSAFIVLAWLLAIALTVAGPIIHQKDYFVKAGAWCWASSKYDSDRLAFHYVWVFMVQFGTIVIYALVLLHLRRTMSVIQPTAQQTETYAKIDRAARLMILYPITYIILTLPLSAGRMWSMAHQGASLPDAYSCVAGTFLAASGFIDSLLYTLTRRALLTNSSPDTSSTLRSGGKGWFRKVGAKSTDHSTVTLGTLSKSDNGGITQTRTVTITDRPLVGPDDDDDKEMNDGYEPQQRHHLRVYRQPSKNKRYSPRSDSPTGSLDRILTETPGPTVITLSTPSQCTAKAGMSTSQVPPYTGNGIFDGSSGFRRQGSNKRNTVYPSQSNVEVRALNAFENYASAVDSVKGDDDELHHNDDDDERSSEEVEFDTTGRFRARHYQGQALGNGQKRRDWD